MQNTDKCFTPLFTSGEMRIVYKVTWLMFRKRAVSLKFNNIYFPIRVNFKEFL